MGRWQETPYSHSVKGWVEQDRPRNGQQQRVLNLSFYNLAGWNVK